MANSQAWRNFKKPHRVIEARDLHPRREVRHAVRKERCGDERVIGRVREEVVVERRIVRELRDRLDPHVALRRSLRRRERIVLEGDRPLLERARRERALAEELRHLVAAGEDALLLRRQGLGRRHRGHRIVVLEARLDLLERRGEVEDRRAVLDRDDPPRGERAAVARAVDVVGDGLARVARPQEVRVHRVDVALRRHRLHRRGERLAEHLAAVDRAPAEVLALATEEVFLDPLEREELHERIEDVRHGLLW